MECVDRGLDPFKVNLVVADPERGGGTIVLAVSPAMKALGVPGRCRVFEIPKGIKYVMTPPRMNLYMQKSKQIVGIYLRYVSPDDIHVYSVDECFIDATDYLRLYHKTEKEFANMLRDFSVMDYLLFGTANQAKFYQAPNEKAKEKVIGIADRLGIRYLLKKDLGGISGGERQIVSIASSIAQDTSIILLDEPTSALDICNQYKVLSVLKEIAEKENKTIVLSTHNPNHALFLGAEVYLLNRGVIVDHGTATDIVRPEKLKPVYGEKIGYCRDLPYDEISFSESFQGSKSATQ